MPQRAAGAELGGCVGAAWTVDAASSWRQRRSWRSGLEAERCGRRCRRTCCSSTFRIEDRGLTGELGQIGLHVDGSAFWRGAIACTGTEFCKLAITETKGFTRWLVDELEERLPEFDQQLKLHVTGCPNSCGQHWIADIGMEGKKIKHEGKLTDAYYFCLGGAVGQHAEIARPVGYRCPAPLVPEAIERLLRNYLSDRQAGRESARMVRPSSNDELRGTWPAKLEAVERDLPRAAYRTAWPIEGVKPMSLLPIFLKLDGRRCLVVGAGHVAQDKIAQPACGWARLQVVAPEALPEIQRLAVEGRLEWVQRDLRPEDLDGNWLAIAATNVPDVNAAVYREAMAADSWPTAWTIFPTATSSLARWSGGEACRLPSPPAGKALPWPSDCGARSTRNCRRTWVPGLKI